jgi:hypothetical protein
MAGPKPAALPLGYTPIFLNSQITIAFWLIFIKNLAYISQNASKSIDKMPKMEYHYTLNMIICGNLQF